MVECPFEFPKSPKDELYLQLLAMIEIDIEAVAGVEHHKEVPVAKLHEEVDLVKARIQSKWKSRRSSSSERRSPRRRSPPERKRRSPPERINSFPKEAVQEDIAEVVPRKE